MDYEIEQLSQIKNVLERLKRGINPLTGKIVREEEEGSFLKHVEIGKCLATAEAIVDSLIRKELRKRKKLKSLQRSEWAKEGVQ
ncbi:MAG: hypothetical protein PVH64_07280 [Bacillota bacterium]|jgi:hypothetical protein